MKHQVAAVNNTQIWEHFPHDADIGIRGIGNNLEKAFEMAGLALTAVVTSPDKVEPSIKIKIECRETDIELLFLDWINALIYEMDTRRMVFSQFKVRISDNLLTAEIAGETVDSKKHDPAVDIKGATMTELKVAKIDNHWTAQCVVDV